ncbi:MAG: PD40 domain-containing protein [Pirellulales bacterium]|nr:PD40 domain-containing protein [Pirellulales bacterium]
MIRFAPVMCLAAALLLFGPATPVAGAGLEDVEEIVFACRQPSAGSHWYENFGYYAFDENDKTYRAMGRLCRLNLRTGAVEVLVDDPQGTVRDPQVHYDGRTILFSYRRGDSEHFHLYEIQSDGSGLRQLTDGPYDDFEPTYLPDGRIMFCSSRCNRWVNCWYTPVAVLHACDADGGNIRTISANIEHDNTPWPLPDGRVIYQRWEYVDRSRVAFHHLWTANPDGTAQMIYYGNLHPGTLMIDAKPIPGTENQVVAVFSPGHGQREHAGALAIVTPKAGPDDLGSARTITKDTDYRDPYPLSEDCFLAARGATLLAVDGRGRSRELYRLPPELQQAGVHCHEPRPLRPRPRERVIPCKAAARQPTGRLILSNVYSGRRMEGVEPGDIRRLLVLETLPKPINYSGKMPPMSFGGTYTLERVVGTVPVEPDGSAYMELPALRSFFFVALDENNNSVKRMHSFLTVMPDETTSCVGCHEHRTRTPANPGRNALAALQRPPSKVQPLEGIPEVFDFPRDVQPILDEHCLDCHDYQRREGGVILSGDRGPIYSHSYYTLTALNEVSDGRDRLETNLPPRAVGTSASPLMQKLDGSHYDARPTPHQQDMIRYWIESAAAYPGTYAALGTGMIGGFPRSRLETSDRQWPSSIAASEAIRRRCLGCHDRSMPLPQYLSDNLDLVLSNPDFDDVRVRWSRHLMFNLTRPEKSLILLGPLARDAGGYGLCKQRSDGQPGESAVVFADTGDPDYGKILALCRDGQAHLERIKRFDMPGFRPTPTYVREMKKYGILPADLSPNAEIDVYATEAAYWRSLWYRPKEPW